jgi:HAD superfamily hydrolase (TIGR01484 family)
MSQVERQIPATEKLKRSSDKMHCSIASTLALPKPAGDSIDLPAVNVERTFYEQRAWCLNAFPTTREVIAHLRDELNELRLTEKDWRNEELLTNVFLLSCAISDTVDDYLAGTEYDFSQAAGVFGPARLVIRPLSRCIRFASHVRASLLNGLSRWRDDWESALGRFIADFASGDSAARMAADLGNKWLLPLLDYHFPSDLLSTRSRIPAAFRSQDLTHFDAFALGRKFIQAYPDRSRPILVAGLRTAGSFFAPLLRGYLESQGYESAASVTLRPKRNLVLRERTCLARAASRGGLAIVVDEPVDSAGSVSRGIDCLKKAGFRSSDIVTLFPTHPKRDWKSGPAAVALGESRVFTLEPEEWHKARLLENEAANRIREYFGAAGVPAEVKFSAAAERLTAALENHFEPGLHWRFKRVFEVEICEGRRACETHFILAKSVGWGWLGYHAFLAATRLEEFVPRVLGLRDGILYMEWVAPGANTGEIADRSRFTASAASYVAARVRTLALPKDPVRDLAQSGRHRGTEELAGVLSGAYGSKIASALKRPEIQSHLAGVTCAVPTLIDGKMRPLEWMETPKRIVKVDFEHHGMGKHELNLTDPAYDLAELILHADLSEEEERDLVKQYADRSGDLNVSERLFLYKLLAGTWTTARAASNLKDPSVIDHHNRFNQTFLNANRFLTVHTTRFCAGLCNRLAELRWSNPLVVLDVDGVLDKQVFGFPSTSAAGIEAVSLLASHGMAVALNTARSVSEMKEYCKAYGFVGGVAEYGGFAWDAISGRGEVLVSPETLDQMERLRDALRRIPGTFLHHDYRLVVRAHVHARGTTVALPDGLIRNLIASLKLNRVRLHQTYTDSTITAAEVDKGSGLKALLSLAGVSGLETLAVGDSEPDLPMFRAASRCFAPSQIACSQPARMLGCRIVGRPYQSGLLEIVRSIVHPNGGSCPRCRLARPALPKSQEIFMNLLRMADRSRLDLLLRSMLDPKAIRAFRK